MSQALALADEAIAEREWERAIDVLQAILEADEDACVSPSDPRSVQATAEAQLAALPIEARQVYERRFSPAAEALLERGQQSGDPQLLEEVVRRHFQTRAGRASAWKLAILRQDQGAGLSAALLFDRLLADSAALPEFGDELSIRAATAWLAAGNTAAAEAHVERLRASGREAVTVAGRQLPIPAAGPETLAWLHAGLSPAPSPANATTAAEPLPPFFPPTQPAAWSAAPLCTDEVLANYPERAVHLNLALRLLERDQRAKSALDRAGAHSRGAAAGRGGAGAGPGARSLERLLRRRRGLVVDVESAGLHLP